MSHSRVNSILFLVSLIVIAQIVYVYASGALYAYGTRDQVASPENNYIDNITLWIGYVASNGSHSVSAVITNSEATSNQILEIASTTWKPAFLFFIGHGYHEKLEIGEATYWVYMIFGDDGKPVYDNSIYQKTGTMNYHLVFLYSCYQGEVIGGEFRLCAPYYHYGMPQAWLHTSFLSMDGYKDPDHNGYVFIGWRGPAPYLSSDLFQKEHTLYTFVRYFYQKLFGYGTTPGNINQALDYASEKVFGEKFEDTPHYNGFYLDNIYTKMIVYGDGSYDGW